MFFPLSWFIALLLAIVSKFILGSCYFNKKSKEIFAFAKTIQCLDIII